MTAAHLALPRDQAGAHPQRLLATLLADYTIAAPPGMTSENVVRLLAEFEISESGARSALTRVADRELLERHRVGTETRYQLSPHARRIHAERVNRVVQFGEAPTTWSGEWTLLTPVGTLQRAQRRRFVAALERAHFGRLGESWIHPYAPVELARTIAADHEIPVIATRARADFYGVTPADAFDLASLSDAYLRFIATYEIQQVRSTISPVDPSEALRIRTSVLRDWRLLVLRDPNLPQTHLPADWPMQRARAIFVLLRDKLAAPAVERVRALAENPAADLDWEHLN